MEIRGEPGENIWRAARRTIKTAAETNRDYYLNFNGVVVRVYPQSHEYDTVEKWDLLRRIQYGN